MAAKRQPDHKCPACGRHSQCQRFEGEPACEVPHEIICGSCALKYDRLKKRRKKK